MFNPLALPGVDKYVRKIDPIGQAREQYAQHLHISTGDPIEICRAAVGEMLGSNGVFQTKDPIITYFHRPEGLDRRKEQAPLTEYIYDSLKEGRIIAPTLTVYENPDVRESFTVKYISTNKKERSIAKKAGFAYREAGDLLMYAVKEVEQTGRKRKNNALSGTRLSPSTPLFNPTGHSVLTSICRITSGYGNANNEKLLAGNRHYYNPDIVISNIVSIVTNVDYDLLERVTIQYKLYVPSAQEICELIQYSSDLYWINRRHFEPIRELVDRLDDLQRVAFAYVGDMYHLRVFNEQLIRDLLTEIIQRDESPHPDAMGRIERALSGETEYLFFGHQICRDFTKGIGMKHRENLTDIQLSILASTIDHIEQTVVKYSPLLSVFFATTNVPASVASFPDSIRRSVMISDTDSTIFTVQEWVKWYKGNNRRDPVSISITAAMVFFAACSIIHLLAQMSINLGVARRYISDIAMKSEFEYDPIIPTNLGKHYYGYRHAQEGNIFVQPKDECKGVYLLNSAVPRMLIEKTEAMRFSIMDAVCAGEMIYLTDYLTRVANIEREIVESITKGESTYLRQNTIKDPASYSKGPDESPYQHHQFWNEVFGEKYGMMPSPPYVTLKISLTTSNPTKMTVWLKGMADQSIAMKIGTWIKKKGRTEMTTIQLPTLYLKQTGIPPELIAVIDYDRMIGDLMTSFYLVLETLGYYGRGDKIKRLAYSEHVGF